jgi:hypothetical protein
LFATTVRITIIHEWTDQSVRREVGVGLGLETGGVWTANMNQRWIFRPDLVECMLEERYLLAIPNLGLIVPTTSGYVLLTPFPGANSSGAGSLGSNGPGGASAASVSGTPIPFGFFITGAGGISSMRPGNLTGIASFSSSEYGAEGGALSIKVGSGSDDAASSNGGAPTAVVSRNTVADPTAGVLPPAATTSSSASDSGVLPAGQTYRDTAPVAPTPPLSMSIPGTTPAGPMTSPAGLAMPDPYNPVLQGAGISSGPFSPGRSLTGPLPGSLPPAPTLMPIPMPGGN